MFAYRTLLVNLADIRGSSAVAINTSFWVFLTRHVQMLWLRLRIEWSPAFCNHDCCNTSLWQHFPRNMTIAKKRGWWNCMILSFFIVVFPFWNKLVPIHWNCVAWHNAKTLLRPANIIMWRQPKYRNGDGPDVFLTDMRKQLGWTTGTTTWSYCTCVKASRASFWDGLRATT